MCRLSELSRTLLGCMVLTSLPGSFTGIPWHWGLTWFSTFYRCSNLLALQVVYYVRLRSVRTASGNSRSKATNKTGTKGRTRTGTGVSYPRDFCEHSENKVLRRSPLCLPNFTTLALIYLCIIAAYNSKCKIFG